MGVDRGRAKKGGKIRMCEEAGNGIGDKGEEGGRR